MLGKKTGGRIKGSKNKPKVLTSVTTDVAAAVATAGDGGAAPGGILTATRAREKVAADPAFPKYRAARVDTLVPYVNNARTHSPAQIGKIASSIKEFGFTNPILTDGKRGIVAGHGRVLAAQKLGMEMVPTIELSHLSKAQRRAYVLADNRLALDAGWDDELLALELGELRDFGFDLSLTGFDAGELSTLFAEPDFDPVGEEKQGRLDERTPITCPNCGHIFAPPSISGGAAPTHTLQINDGQTFAETEASRTAPAKAARVKARIKVAA